MVEPSRPVSLRAAALLACVPFAPLLIAIVIHLPLQHHDVTPLTGRWDVAAWDDLPPRSGQPTSVELPGRLPRLSQNVRLHKRIMLPHGADEPQLLVFGGVSNGVASLQLNGVWIGDEGVPGEHYKLERVGLAAYAVPPSLLRAGDNDVVVTIVPAESPLVSLVDARVVLGPSSIVRPWFDRTVIGKRLLETGGIPLLVAIIALAFALSRLEQDAEMRALQQTACGMSFGVLLYLAGTSGLLGPLGGTGRWIALSVASIALFLPELAERACRGGTTRFVVVNRVVCVVDIVVQFATNDPIIYRAFIPWLLFDVGWSSVLAIRALARRPPSALFALCMSVLAMAVAGANDLLTDLGVITTPRLFTLAAIDMAVIGAAFLVDRFLHTMRANEALRIDVEHKNVRLQHALTRAEETTRLKNALLANTSHELRTPLNSIINVPTGLLDSFRTHDVFACGECREAFVASADIILSLGAACPACGAHGTMRRESRTLFDGDADAAAVLLRDVQRSGTQLLAVVDDLLDLSRLQAGQLPLHITRVALAPLLSQVHKRMSPRAVARSIDVRVELSIDGYRDQVVDELRESVQHAQRLTTTGGVDIGIDTDPARLGQVLAILVDNAIKFSPEGSDVRIRTRVEPNLVQIDVIDRGIGIEPDQQARIFDSFVQIDDGHTRTTGGAGLGLAIARQLVELLGGTLSVHSVPAYGATFTVRLPRSRATTDVERRSESTSTETQPG